MRVSVPVAATAILLWVSIPASAADYTGFWKLDCAHHSGVSIKPEVDKTYSLSWCMPWGCQPWRPNSKIDGDPAFRVIDANTLEARADETQLWRRFKKCSTDANLKLELPVPAKPSVVGEPLNPAWLGNWKNQDGTATITISPVKMVYTFQQKNSEGKLERKSMEFKWSDKSDSEDGQEFGYSKARTSPEKIAESYEAAVRQFEHDPTDYGISEPTASRQAIAAIAPGVYKILWSFWAGDCGGWDYILDGDRMLQFSECKYGFDVELFRRVR